MAFNVTFESRSRRLDSTNVNGGNATESNRLLCTVCEVLVIELLIDGD